jgi:flagellar basal body-associated protein FliL
MTDVLQSGVRTTPADVGTTDAPEKPKKSKKKLIILVVVLLGGAYVAKGMLITTHFKKGQEAPPGQIAPLDQLTVNMSDGHLVQTSIDLQLTTVANTKTVTADLPLYDDAAISVIGSETYAGLLAPGGRATLKSQLLAAFQKIAGTSEGAQQVSAVYFTGLVVQ